MRNDDLVSTSEASDLLDCSVATINRHARDGRLPVAKQIDGIRGARFYWRSDVEALKTQEKAS